MGLVYVKTNSTKQTCSSYNLFGDIIYIRIDACGTPQVTACSDDLVWLYLFWQFVFC